MILIIDNYDSFTYNLYQYIGCLNPDIQVYRNDAISVTEVLELKPSHIVLSPGPGYPREAGLCISLIQKAGDIPLLGVCLGHQAIGEAFGSNIVRAPRIMHGKADMARIHKDQLLFAGLPKEVEVGRYHSLVIEKSSLPGVLDITASSDDGCIMGISHIERPVFGIQFHPESVLTPQGMKIIENFLNI